MAMVIAMTTPINMNNLVDIHNHILFGVDDGSQSIETSIEMIRKEIKDGVKTIILTPHVQSRVTKATKEEQLRAFHSLKERLQSEGLHVNLYLAAEIFYRSHLEPNYDDYVLGESKAILLEFSPMVETPIEEICFDLMAFTST